MSTASSRRFHERHVIRLLTGGVGVVAALVSVSYATVVVQPDVITIPLWCRIMIGYVMLFPVAAAVAALWAGVPVLRRLNSIAVVNYAVLLIVVWPAVTIGMSASPSGQLPWVLTSTTAAVVSAVVAWGQLGGWLTLISATIAVQVLRGLISDDIPNAIVNDVHVFLASMLMCVLCGILITASRDLDAASAAAAGAAARKAAEQARRSAQVRTESLVHDEVLATLLLASHNVAAFRDAVAEQARKTRLLIRDLAQKSGSNGGVGLGEFVDRCRELTANSDNLARFEVVDRRVGEAPAATMRPEVADALLGALRQALLNSLAHAGVSASRVVSVTLTADCVDLMIEDDGVGFVASGVQRNRMGISSSIIGRVGAVPGGSARVESRIGEGTAVLLSWSTSQGAPGGGVSHPGGALETANDPGRLLMPQSQGLMIGMRIGLLIFVASQIGLALYETIVTAEPLVSFLALGGIVLAAAALGWRDPGVLGRWKTALVVTLVAATSSIIFVATAFELLTYSDVWYLTGCAFVLVGLSLRRRLIASLVGLVLLCAITVAGVVAHGYSGTEVAASLARPIVIVSLGIALVLSIARMRALTTKEHAAELEARREESFAAVSGDELQRESEQLDKSIGPMLDILQRGDELDLEHVGECRALEGRLRDRFRGGRLAREPLEEVTMVARRRGIDVVLLDDRGDVELDEGDLEEIVAWIAQHLDVVQSGRFIGRIMPHERDALASAVFEGEAWLFKKK